MKTMQGPGLFLAQFAADEAPFDSWDAITRWAADCGYAGVQVPSWDARLIDLDRAATSKDYCDELVGIARGNGVEVTELSTHLQGLRSIFSRLAAHGYDGWAVVEWECCLEHPEDGAREGAAFVREHIIRVTDKAFDDFADGGTDDAANRRMLGIGAE